VAGLITDTRCSTAFFGLPFVIEYRYVNQMDTELLNDYLSVAVLFEEDGESSRYDDSREWWLGATEPLVVDEIASLFSAPTGESGYPYHVREAKRKNIAIRDTTLQK
jgi:hypothetical protein